MKHKEPGGPEKKSEKHVHDSSSPSLTMLQVLNTYVPIQRTKLIEAAAMPAGKPFRGHRNVGGIVALI